jgi:hypothetical protein
MKMQFFKIFILIICCLTIKTEFTNTECTCGFEFIFVCPGLIQCTRACWDYTGMSVCVPKNEASLQHYCLCTGNKKTSEEKNKNNYLLFLE